MENVRKEAGTAVIWFKRKPKISIENEDGEVSGRRACSGNKETQTRKMKYENTGCHNELVIDDFQERGFMLRDFSSHRLVNKDLANFTGVYEC